MLQQDTSNLGFIHSFNIYLLNIYYVQNSVLGIM